MESFLSFAERDIRWPIRGTKKKTLDLAACSFTKKHRARPRASIKTVAWRGKIKFCGRRLNLLSQTGRPKIARTINGVFNTTCVKPILGPVFWLWTLSDHLPGFIKYGNQWRNDPKIKCLLQRRIRVGMRVLEKTLSPTSRSSSFFFERWRAKLPPEGE